MSIQFQKVIDKSCVIHYSAIIVVVLFRPQHQEPFWEDVNMRAATKVTFAFLYFVYIGHIALEEGRASASRLAQWLDSPEGQQAMAEDYAERVESRQGEFLPKVYVDERGNESDGGGQPISLGDYNDVYGAYALGIYVRFALVFLWVIAKFALIPMWIGASFKAWSLERDRRTFEEWPRGESQAGIVQMDN